MWASSCRRLASVSSTQAISAKRTLGLTNRFSSSLVIAEHNNASLAGSTLNTITAAKQLGDVTVLLAGNFQGKAELAQEVAKVDGVSKVAVIDSAAFDNSVAEIVTSAVVEAQSQLKASHVVAPASSFGKNVLGRIASVLDVEPVADVISIKSADTFVRPIYAGNALATVKSTDAVKLLSVRSTTFDKAKPRASGAAEIVTLKAPEAPSTPVAKLLREDVVKSARPELTSARIVVSGGRALKSAENFKIIEKLADTIGGAVGASRAAVDEGYAPNDYQVGQTGKIVAPEVYIAVGISGAIQHMAGMKDSKVIVAINKDPEAPIFQVSDYGIVQDLFNAVPELTKILEKK
eukprot:TRINITY_DN998_c0_g1_i1.p1 TRINITY_DN998_c0_g1~~TRINITY_DN998_c0_g1_i1.p1  ORF type:complete len:349 (+),score=121.20 TRINITY_DN998_c0_g1_i1:104-1150(+)